jgi:hypothetical protein
LARCPADAREIEKEGGNYLHAQSIQEYSGRKGKAMEQTGRIRLALSRQKQFFTFILECCRYCEFWLDNPQLKARTSDRQSAVWANGFLNRSMALPQ